MPVTRSAAKKPKLQEQPSTKIQKLQEPSTKVQKLQEPSTKVQKLQGQSASTSTSTQPGTRFLVSRLPLFVTEEKLRKEFGTYGEIVAITFVHRPDRDYTLSCVVEITLHDDAAGERLVQTQHRLGDLRVDVELCTGNGHRVLEVGTHALEIHNVKVKGSWNTNGEMIYNFLENTFHHFSYSEMELRKISRHKYSGEVVIFFHSAIGRQQAMELIASKWPNWVVVQQDG